MRHLVRITFMVLCSVLLLGNSQCQNSNTSSPTFVTTMDTEDGYGSPETSFAIGQTIQFVLRVRNRTDTDQTLYMQPCVYIYEFAVVNSGTSNVVTSLIGPQGGCNLLVNAGQPVTIPAGQTNTYVYNWDQTDASDQLVPPGNYEVMGGLVCYNSQNTQMLDTVDCFSQAITADEISPALLRTTLVQFTIQ